MRLLLVEDDLAIQDFLKRALIEAGYQVDVLRGGLHFNLRDRTVQPLLPVSPLVFAVGWRARDTKESFTRPT